MADKIRIPVNGPNLRSCAGPAAPGYRPPGGSAGAGGASSRGNAPGDPKPPGSGQAGASPGHGAAPKSGPQPKRPPAAAPEPPAPPQPEAVPAAQAPAAANLEAALAESEAKGDEYLDQLLRLKAEFENYRKRVRREVDEASLHSTTQLLTQFLPVLDNLERALAAAEHHEEGKVLSGVRMTQGQFLDLLQKHGVEQINPLGQQFDPALHDALLSQPSSEPEGTVVAVLEKGYKLGERLVRPARVAVSAGPADQAGE